MTTPLDSFAQLKTEPRWENVREVCFETRIAAGPFTRVDELSPTGA